MIYILLGTSIVTFVFAALYSIDALVNGVFIAKCTSVIFWIVTFAICYAVIELGNKGPCVKHETQMNCNAATKTMMPERVVDIAIRDGVKAEMPYKDIYQLAKERASHVVQAIGVIGGEL